MRPFDGCVPGWRVATGLGLICLAAALFVLAVRRENGWLTLFCGFLFLVGSFIWLTGHYCCDCQQQTEYRQAFQHDAGNVSQKPSLFVSNIRTLPKNKQRRKPCQKYLQIISLPY